MVRPNGDAMLAIYHLTGSRLTQTDADPAGAIWLDLCKPSPEEAARATPLVPEIPTLEDLDEIEISSRLYHDGDFDVMTVLVPGLSHDDRVTPIIGPAAFILGQGRLVTVRYHQPRPFETYPHRADKVGLGCTGADRIFLGLCEEIIGRVADLLEGAGRELDQVARAIFKPDGRGPAPDLLQHALEVSGRQSELVGNCRLSLLTLDRALSFFHIGQEERGQLGPLKSTIEALSQDIKSLEVHGDYLSSRVTQVMDATLGMINLAQNTTVRIVSVVAALFLPPTLVASIYGMNFRLMPELGWTWGYPLALGLMVGSAVLTYLVFRWKKWL